MIDPLLRGATAAWWAETDVAAPSLTIVAPALRDVLVTLRCELTFGPLKYAWSDGPHLIAEASSTEVAIAIPEEAFLHPLATGYVSDLRVQVEAVHDERPVVAPEVPNLFVAWSVGPDATPTPVVWTETEVASHAPGGVLDPRLSAEVAPTDRVLPPIWHESTAAPVGEDPPGVTVPADDQRDEVQP